MEKLVQQYKCSICMRYLNRYPLTCMELICLECYDEVRLDGCSICPACHQSIGDVQTHFRPDRAVARDMRKLSKCCRGCNSDVLLADLREHLVACCPLGEEAPGDGDDSPASEGEEVAPPEDALEAVPGLPEEATAQCLYRRFGCLFQGTRDEVVQHVAHPSGATPECEMAKVLAIFLEFAETLQVDLYEEKRQIQELTHHLSFMLHVLHSYMCY